MVAVDAPHIIDDELARRNALVLASASAIAGATAPITIALGGLAGHYLLGADKSLATVPVTTFILGTACGTIPAANLMRFVSRRAGFQTGTVVAMAGGLLACYAIVLGSFRLFCLGTFLVGSSFAFVQQYRFAAADIASDAFKPKAISWVMAGGIVAAVVGPQTAIYTKDLLSPYLFAGAFAAQAGLSAIGLVILSFVNIPHVKQSGPKSGGRPLSEIVAQPRFIIAVICAISAYALMSLVMTAAPLAMVACDHSQANAALGIQWHVMAMFGPSFFTGHLIARFGKEKIVAVGMLLLAACAAIALSGITLAHFWAALILLGLGWNFGFIGATTMVTDTYRPEERAKVQATNDFTVFGCVALASFSSGQILDAFGWEAVNYGVFPIVALCLLAILWARGRDKKAAV